MKTGLFVKTNDWKFLAAIPATITWLTPPAISRNFTERNVFLVQ
ncbi:MAG TPA: hypothetical protein VK525_07625 [Candidatus Saccharimonadales bacterium]|nr:hypothetical protein [Candidatus Saccharimonadales bacterium]